MQTALDSQRTLFFEIENVIGAISKLVINPERPEQALASITSIIKSAKKLLSDAESNSRVAYSQLLTSRKISDTVEIERNHFPDWKTSVKISGNEILDLEITLSDLLASLLSSNQQGLITKVRESCSKLLKIGIQLPQNTVLSEKENLDAEIKKIFLLNIKSTAKNELKDILNKISAERRNLKIEHSLMQKELESKMQDFDDLEQNIKQVKDQIEDKSEKIRKMFESHLLKPFEDIWAVYQNSEQSSAVQFFMVFKLHASKIKEFIDFLFNFKF